MTLFAPMLEADVASPQGVLEVQRAVERVSPAQDSWTTLGLGIVWAIIKAHSLHYSNCKFLLINCKVALRGKCTTGLVLSHNKINNVYVIMVISINTRKCYKSI